MNVIAARSLLLLGLLADPAVASERGTRALVADALRSDLVPDMEVPEHDVPAAAAVRSGSKKLGVEVSSAVSDRAARLVAASREVLARVSPLVSDVEEFAPAAGPLESAAVAQERLAALLKQSSSDDRPLAAEIRAATRELGLALETLRTVTAAGTARVRERLERPTAVVVSGGVSLGSYQAGFLHFYTQYLLAYERFLKGFGAELDAEHAGRFDIATGASAGSINGFLALLAGCREPVEDPERSLFFRTWIPVGMESLFVANEVGRKALLSRKPIDDAVSRVNALWQSTEGWRKDSQCAGLLGMSVTPLRRREIDIEPARDPHVRPAPPPLQVHRSSEKFMFELKPGADGLPRFRVFPPYPPDGLDGLRAFYPAFGDGSKPEFSIAEISTLLEASASFPLAFEPVPLTYTVSLGEERTTSSGDFIDGGVFDNTPLRLAVRMHEWRARRDRQSGASPATAAADPWLLFVEPDATAWSPHVEAKDGGDEDGLLGVYKPFLGAFIAAAREAELVETFESDPALAKRLVMPSRQMPVASSQLSAFLGFFERDFRVFDFYMGMADAWQHLSEHSDQYRTMTSAGGVVPVTSDIFRCFVEYRTASSERLVDDVLAIPACAAINVDAPERCGPIAASGERDPVCPRNMIALLKASARLKRDLVAQSLDGNEETERFFAYLREGKYRFRTLAGGRDDGEHALASIRDTLQDGIHRLGMKQPGFGEKLAVLVAGKATANGWMYRPPQAVASVGVQADRGLELGYAHRLARWGGTSLRAGANARVFQFDKLQLGGSGGEILAFTFMPAVSLGLEIPIKALHAQLEPSIGYGVWLRESWHPLSHVMWRHGPEASLALTIIQRVYFQAGVTEFLDDCKNENACSQTASRWRDRPNPITGHDREYRLGVGWRMLLH